MKIITLAALLLLLPQLASARVYMCVDQATGRTSFTDKACATTQDVREEVRVDRTNLDSGKQYGRAGREKTWRSEEDTRKTGRDFNTSRSSLYDNNATASTAK